MTAQIPETVKINRKRYELCGVRGGGLFNPEEHGIEPDAPHTACGRGFVCGYKVRYRQLLLDELELWSEPSLWEHDRLQLERLFGDKPTFDELPGVDARDLAFPIPFTGGLLIGRNFIEELYVHMGFHPAYKYRDVLELTFEDGRLLTKTDRSEEMAEIRLQNDPDGWSGSEDLVKWIDDSFRLDY